MKVLSDKDLPIKNKTAVAIGLFDGVHIGHLKLIADICKKRDLTPTIFTFNQKKNIVKPILSLNEKYTVFENLGISQCYAQNFNEEFAAQSPYVFLKDFTRDFNVSHIAVGYDFKFGKNARGDIQTLENYKDEFNYSLTVIPQINIDGLKVSSTRIRDCIKNGKMEEATALMNRFYFIEGVVTNGRHLGNKIGFPTANIKTDKLLPKYGVYASIVDTIEGRFAAITNIGVKPTVQQSDIPNVETFLIHFNDELYGQNIRVYLIKMLRGEMKFESIDDLRARIDFDANYAANMLADLDIYKKYLI